MIEIPGLIGGIVGLIGGIFNGFIEVRKHRAETERLEKQWKHELEMFAKETDATREQNADDVFQASVETVDGPLLLPPGSPAWLITPFVLVESLRRATRPLLTWGLVAAAYTNPMMADPAGMAIGWWFGTRTSTKWMSK